MREHEHAQMEATNGALVVLQSVAVAVDVVGMYMAMETTQTYQNPTDDVLEVRYTFPMPATATLLGVSFTVRGKTFVGQVHPAPEARARKQKAVDDGDTVLLLTHSAGLYTANIGNLGAGESVVVTVRSSELLVPNDGTLRIAVPTTIAPRYGNPAASGLSREDAPETDIDVVYPFSYTAQIHGVGAAQLTVPSHVAQIVQSEALTTVRIDGATMDRDVVLLVGGYADYRASVQGMHAGQQWYASFVQIPVLADQVDEPMHVKLLVDCSGSMGGTSIVQARSAVTRLLSLLRDGDSIAVTRFGSNVVDVTPGLMTVGQTVRKQMQQWIKTIDADLGGTETVKALTHVLAMPTNDHPCVVILLTDGEAYGIAAVAGKLSKLGHAVYPLVIGHTPADSELRKLAEATRGFCESVTPNERIDDAIMRVAQRIRSIPVAKSVLETGAAVRAWQSGVVPQFRGLHQLVTGAMDRPAEQVLQVDGVAYPLTTQVVPEAMIGDFSRTVAATHLPNLTSQFRIDWAVTHQLVTEETALVAVAVHNLDEKVIGNTIAVKVQQQMAEDWHGGRMQAVLYSAPQMMPASAPKRRSAALYAMPESPMDIAREMDVDFEIESRGFSSPNNSAAIVAEYEKTRAAERLQLVAQVLLARYPDVADWSFDRLAEVNMNADIIDACKAITGYPEAQIVLALMICILGKVQVGLPADAVAAVPAALLGGLKVIIGA
jgi:Ca-activated chloride channel family protein